MSLYEIGNDATGFSRMGFMGYWPVNIFPRSVGLVRPMHQDLMENTELSPESCKFKSKSRWYKSKKYIEFHIW